MFGAEYIKKMIALHNNDVATRASSSSHIEYHFLEDSFEHDKDVALNLLQNEVNFLHVFVIFRRDHVKFRNNHHGIMILPTNIPFDHHRGYLLLGNYLTRHAPSSNSLCFILYDGSFTQGPNHLVTVTHLFDQQWWLMELWLFGRADTYHSRDLSYGWGFERDCRDCTSIVANKIFASPFCRKPILLSIEGTKIYYSTSDGRIFSNGGEHLVYLGVLFSVQL